MGGENDAEPFEPIHRFLLLKKPLKRLPEKLTYPISPTMNRGANDMNDIFNVCLEHGTNIKKGGNN